MSDHQMIFTYSTVTDKNYYAPHKRFIEIEKMTNRLWKSF